MRGESLLINPMEDGRLTSMNPILTNPTAKPWTRAQDQGTDEKAEEWENIIGDSNRDPVERGQTDIGVLKAMPDAQAGGHMEIADSPVDMSAKAKTDLLNHEGEELKFFLHVGEDKLEAKLLDYPDAIDFGLVGMRVTAASFVGMRYVRPPLDVSPRTRAQAHAHSSVPPTPAKLSPPRRTISDFFSDILSPQQRERRNSLSPSRGFPNRRQPSPARQTALPPWTQGTSPLHQLLGLTPPSSSEKEERRWQFPFSRNGGGGGVSEPEEAGQQPMTPPHVASPPRRDVAVGPPRSSDPGAGTGGGHAHLHTWEVMWKEGKDGKGGGHLQRLKFDTTLAGYNKVRSRLNAWATESSSSTVMTEAARAAVAANGGHLPENHGLSSLRGSPRVSGGGEDVPPLGYAYEGASPLSAGGRRSRRSSGDGEIVSPMARRRSSKDYHRHIALPGGAVQLVGDPNRGGAVVAPGKEPPPPPDTISWGSIMVEGKFLPRREGESLVVKDGQIKALAAALPARLRTSTWVLLYSTSRDGISLSTLYRKVAKKGPSLLLVRDRKQYVFGCFASEDWRIAPRYYGNGECFVFQVNPELRAFKWTRANSYFMFSTADQLAIGGGGHYAMLLRGDLLSGSSGECETFGNKVLASSEEFEVAHVELWGFR